MMKRHNIPIIISLLLSRLKLITAQEGCFSLQNSSACPAFSSFYISLTGNQQTYPFLANVTDVDSFDTALSNYVTSSDFYSSSFGCNNSTIIPYARYSKSYMCATLIQDSSYSLPCNYQYNLSPPPLCQSTCFNFTASLSTDTESCSNQAQELATFNNTCQYWSGLNGTTNCIIGLANEPENCGFASSSDACSYCQSYPNDSCCSETTCHHLSTGAIIGIIVGCLAFAGILGALIWFYCRRNNKNTNTGKHESLLLRNDNYSTAHESRNALLQPTQPSHHDDYYEDIHMHDNGPSSLVEEFYEVKHPYPPQMGDELGLHVGDIVCVAMNFDDGWALGFNVTTGLKGVFPIVCVTPAPEELLEQLLQTEQSTNKILVEDNAQLQQICENIRRSISISSKNTDLTYHDSIPRRTASMMRRGSLNSSSPFFVDNSNSNAEIIEMHPKNNRVSKLQEQ